LCICVSSDSGASFFDSTLLRGGLLTSCHVSWDLRWDPVPPCAPRPGTSFFVSALLWGGLPSHCLSMDSRWDHTLLWTLTMHAPARRSRQDTFIPVVRGRSAIATSMVCSLCHDSTGRGMCLLHWLYSLLSLGGVHAHCVTMQKGLGG
jgi:hypothetical protein